MPKSCYIIAATGMSEDRTTNLLTLFQIIETITVTLIPIPTAEPGQVVPHPGSTTDVSVIAVWTSLPEDDITIPWEHQLTITMPDGTSQIAGPATEFFLRTDDMPLSRFGARLTGMLPVHPGFITLSSQIRRSGTEAWMSQEYSIKVVVDRRESAESM